MRSAFLTLAAALVALAACGGGDGADGVTKSSAVVRAARRAFDGAPPVIPHAPVGVDCLACHGRAGMSVPELGFAPPTPHDLADGPSRFARCVQCHVYRQTDAVFVASLFAGLPQDLRHGVRAHAFAPPTLPHPVLLRENCAACHTGPAAREEIRTSHPERANCRQCHVPVTASAAFRRP